MAKCNRLLALLLLVALVLTCAACQKEEPRDPNLDVLELSLAAATPAELETLEQYPNLTTVDLRGSSCYAAIEDYINAHPQVAVRYDVAIGANRYDPSITELTLEEGAYTYEELLENLQYLGELTSLSLPKTTLAADQLTALGEEYPDLAVSCTVMLGDTELDGATETLDLSHMDTAQLTASLETLGKFPNLKEIQLMTAEGTSQLTKADVKALMAAVPNAAVSYTFDLFGKTVSTADERVEYVNVKVGDEGLAQVREALDIMPNCTYFKLDRCNTSNAAMAQLRDDYPNTKIVWRVFFAFYNCLTDVEMFHCTGRLEDDMVDVLKYCTDAVYLDFGHNSKLSNFDFISYMPKLKIAIIADSAIKTLEPFANCPELEWLEITNCRKLTDISPLANCTKLKGVNISGAFGIKDISPLHGLQEMERLYLGRNSLPEGQFEAACEAMPNCWVTNEAHSASGVSLNYAIGWRLDEDGERAEWYKEVREIFRYSEKYYNHYKNDE